MEKIAIHSAYGLWPLLEYELDIAQRELDKGNEVTFYYCQGNQNICEANKYNANGSIKKRYCVECRSRTLNGLRWLDPGRGKLKYLEYENISLEQRDQVDGIISKYCTSDKNEDIIKKNVNIDNVDIYESAISTLATTIKMSNLKLDKYFKELIQYIKSGLISYFSAINNLSDFNADKIYLYNGRMSRYRPLLRIAQQKKIEISVYEYPYTGFMNYVLIDGTYPHDIGNVADLLKIFFDNSDTPLSEKYKTGESWLSRRVHDSSQVSDVLIPKFTERQVEKKIPNAWREDQFNVALFISSEYELGDIDEVKRSMPHSQVETIKVISSCISNIEIYVRIHPYLENVNHEFVNSIKELGALDGVNIILPESTVDSYYLMELADLIISFGSTTGIEAAFLSKPVLTIGCSYYEHFNATATIRTSEDMLRLIKSARDNDFSEYPDKRQRNLGACLYAFSFLNFGVKPQYILKDKFYGGCMIRKGACNHITSRLIFKIMNRVIDIPSNFLRGMKLVYLDHAKFKKIIKNPYQIICKKFFGDHP